MLDPTRAAAVVFDYGSTLVEFAPAELARCDGAMREEIVRRFGPSDPERFANLRARDRALPFTGDPPSYRESTLDALARGLVEALYDRSPTHEDVEAITQARRNAFVEVTRKPDDVEDVLAALGKRRRLGVLSNYPDGVAIRESIARIGLTKYFETIQVSGDLGVVKPHPEAFASVSRALELPPEAIIYVGDNWLADVQGAKRASMQSILTTQFQTPEAPPRKAGDASPDAIVARLADLPELLA